MGERCWFWIDGPIGYTGRGYTQARPWSRRQCKRNVADGSHYCWQHMPLDEVRERAAAAPQEPTPEQGT